MAKKVKSKKSSTTKVSKNSSGIFKDVQKLYGFMEKNRLETLEYQQGDSHIKLSRQRPSRIPVPVAAMAPAQAGQLQATAPVVAQNHGETIKSPLMGIFFRAPSPSSPPFVKEGESVKKGQVLCLIEAMKVFNEVKAEFDCTVNKVIVDNGQPIKIGQPLFAISKK
jgi:acetyl-CoA carboxylase biotin carboxyl carrier protein